ncbi:MAG: hypothetical protein JXR70_09320 [Spirochaetales bacterium]|nr:hypothetical protein [Spirochaetales bacterium]
MKNRDYPCILLIFILVNIFSSCKLHKLELPDYPVAAFGEIKALKVCNSDSTIRYPQIVKGETDFGMLWLEKKSEKNMVFFAPICINRAKAAVDFPKTFCVSENASYPALSYNQGEFVIAYYDIDSDKIHIEQRSAAGELKKKLALDSPVHSSTPKISFCQNAPAGELALCWINTKAPDSIHFVFYDKSRNIIMDSQVLKEEEIFSEKITEKIFSENIAGIYFQSYYYLFWSGYDPGGKELEIFRAVYDTETKSISDATKAMNMESGDNLVDEPCLSITQWGGNLILATGLLFNESSCISLYSFNDTAELSNAKRITAITKRKNEITQPIIRSMGENLLMAWSVKSQPGGIAFQNTLLPDTIEKDDYLIQQDNYQAAYPSLCWDQNHPVLLWCSEEDSQNLWIAF